MSMRITLQMMLAALLAASLLGAVPVQGQDGSAGDDQASAEELRAQAAEKLAEAAGLESKAEKLEARAAAMADDAVSKRDLAARRIASAEKKEAKAEKRPAQADRLLSEAAGLRERAADLTKRADELRARADWRNNKAAGLRATAAALSAEAAELYAAADELDRSAPLWTTTLTVGVLNADRVNERLGFQDAYSYEHGNLSNKTVVDGDASYTISGLTWSKLRREVWIVAQEDSWAGLAAYFDDKWLSCILDGASVVSGRLEARFIKARESLKLDVQSAPWAEGDTVVCEVLASESASG